MFLRHAKFSQLKARDVIEKNCVLKTDEVDLFNNYDPLDATMQRFLRTGWVEYDISLRLDISRYII